MRRIASPIVALTCALLLLAAGTAPAAETVKSLVKKVDSRLYYPQRRGLRTLQADVQSSFLQSQLQNYPEAKNVKLTFYWSAPYRQRFVISGAPASMAYEAHQVENQLSMWGDRLVPRPLASVLKDYKSTLKDEGETFVIDARTTNPSAFAWAMRYTINKKTLLPDKWHLSTNNWDADVNIKYRKVGAARYLPAEMKAEADGTEVTIRQTYKKVGKLTLPESLTVAFTNDSGTEQSSSLKLSNHKVNQPIPASVFPPEKK